MSSQANKKKEKKTQIIISDKEEVTTTKFMDIKNIIKNYYK